jgi:citrate lyase beta subunit
MIHSYFFIPGNHPKLLEKISTIQSDYVIIDLEDSIEKNEIEDVLCIIKNIPNKTNLFVRPRIFDGIINNTSALINN